MLVKEVEILKPKKILIVEDEKHLQCIITETFDKIGITYEACSNGLDALKMIESEEIDLILTDIDMPYMNGLELIEDVKHLHIPTIIMSAHTEPEYRQLENHNENIYYLPKPFDFMKFLNISYKIFNS